MYTSCWLLPWYYYCDVRLYYCDIRTTFISDNSTIWWNNIITQKACNRKYTWLPFLVLHPSGYSIWGTENWLIFEGECEMKLHKTVLSHFIYKLYKMYEYNTMTLRYMFTIVITASLVDVYTGFSCIFCMSFHTHFWCVPWQWFLPCHNPCRIVHMWHRRGNSQISFRPGHS